MAKTITQYILTNVNVKLFKIFSAELGEPNKFVLLVILLRPSVFGGLSIIKIIKKIDKPNQICFNIKMLFYK